MGKELWVTSDFGGVCIWDKRPSYNVKCKEFGILGSPEEAVETEFEPLVREIKIVEFAAITGILVHEGQCRKIRVTAELLEVADPPLSDQP